MKSNLQGSKRKLEGVHLELYEYYDSYDNFQEFKPDKELRDLSNSIVDKAIEIRRDIN